MGKAEFSISWSLKLTVSLCIVGLAASGLFYCLPAGFQPVFTTGKSEFSISWSLKLQAE
jgi:hypothetical protein